MHEGDPGLAEYFPGLQFVHEDDPLVEDVPALQLAHSWEAGFEEY